MPPDPPRLHDPEEHEQEEFDPIMDPQTPADERQRATFVVPHKLLIAIALLLLVYLVAAALGIEISVFSSQTTAPTPTRVYPPSAAGGEVVGQSAAKAETGADEEHATPPPDAGDSLPAYVHPVDPLFREYWERHGNIRTFGHAISPLKVVDGRSVQWFERGRLEELPELAGSEHAVQPGLVGREYTHGLDFPHPAPFPSRADLWYFPETGHALGGRFLNFWREHGGLAVFGYPISEEIREVLPSDGQVHVVQYFERARMEYHPQFQDSQNEVMLGLLGHALLFDTGRPHIVPESMIAPTPVPSQQ